MKLSTRVRYGVRALFDMAYQRGQEPVQIKDIARRQKISANYLEQILLRFKRAGLVQSRRGPQGGYLLTRPLETISLAEIVAVCEGEIHLVDCAGTDRPHQVCPMIEKCATHRLWKESSALLTEYFASVTLADLCRSAEDLGVLQDQSQKAP